MKIENNAQPFYQCCLALGCSKVKPLPARILDPETVEIVWTVKDASGKSFEFRSKGARYTAQFGKRSNQGESTHGLQAQVCQQIETELDTAVTLHKGDTTCDMHVLVQQPGQQDSHPSCQAIFLALHNSFAGWEQAQLMAGDAPAR